MYRHVHIFDWWVDRWGVDDDVDDDDVDDDAILMLMMMLMMLMMILPTGALPRSHGARIGVGAPAHRSSTKVIPLSLSCTVLSPLHMH